MESKPTFLPAGWHPTKRTHYTGNWVAHGKDSRGGYDIPCLDHPVSYLTPTGRRVIMSFQYWLSNSEASTMNAYAEKHGLQWFAHDKSDYGFGTVAVACMLPAACPWGD